MKRVVLVLAALLAGCASMEQPSTLSVSQLQSRKAELHGQVVLVQGYLTACQYSRCKFSAEPNADAPSPSGLVPLSVGGDHAFAAGVSVISPAEVVLKARVGATPYVDPDTGAVRADCCDLEAIEIVRVVREIDGNSL